MPNSNNSINNTVGASSPGQTTTLTVQNTGTGAANVNMQAGGISGGNIWTQYTVGTTRSYAMGTAQNGTLTNPPFVISTTNSGTIDPGSGTQSWIMNSVGGLALFTQPAFLYFYDALYPGIGGTWLPVTGDGTQYQIGSTANSILTKVYDQGNNVNAVPGPTGGVFTAPIAGVYFFESNCIITNCTRTETLCRLEIGPPLDPEFQIDLLTASNGPGAPVVGSIEAGGDSGPVNGTFQLTMQTSGYHNLAAGDTIAVFILVAGGSPPPGYPAKYVAVLSNGNDHLTYFAGHLVA